MMPPPCRPHCWRPLDHQRHDRAFFFQMHSFCSAPSGIWGPPRLVSSARHLRLCVGTLGQLLLCEALPVEPALAGLVARNVLAANKEPGRQCYEQYHCVEGMQVSQCLLLQPPGLLQGHFGHHFYYSSNDVSEMVSYLFFFSYPNTICPKEFGGCPKLT